MKIFAVISLFLLSINPVFADDMPMGLINLDATALTEVDNDELVVQLQIQARGNNTAELTDSVNKKATLMLDALTHFPMIEAQTSQYSTQPIYQEGKIKQWQVSQTFTLKTAEFKKMTVFLADINSLAQIKSMRFQVSSKLAEEVKQSLIKQAIGDFKHKAKLVATQFEYPSYELVSLNIGDTLSMPQPMMERAMMMADESMSYKSEPAIAAGKNTISVTVSGSVMLSLN